MSQPGLKALLLYTALGFFAAGYGVRAISVADAPAVAAPDPISPPAMYIHTTTAYPQGRYYIELESKDGRTREVWEVSQEDYDRAELGTPASEQDREKWRGKE